MFLIQSTSLTPHQPESSGLHIHPLTEAGSELGDQISVISSEKQKKGGGITHQQSDVSRFASAGWHTDITFEPVPSDYAMLKIHTLPATGGDTVSSLLQFYFLSDHLIALGIGLRDLRPSVPCNANLPLRPHCNSRCNILPR